MTAIRTSLARWQPERLADEAEMHTLAGAAWRDRGWACLPVDSIRSEWLRRGIEAEMIARHGRRKPQGGR